ncbi:uncharacterized protein FOMMEDRAFT_139875 [Fomitiporia mediterranea MF3/22]|uniref:uncharacterized protein n=1 Tax=Fomitiporia mediterranea (strain MF3/22) TaxID=694068 RepID=UPI0004409784|nr:uncharacterized protein FOMMEDRAFT_139875 [Fomitiporia mediterranea MF3/22]EJD03707.1 hypothetical protein FOMMEDRAFT_139875 [Fomitiporia mediterranea MF3/22]
MVRRVATQVHKQVARLARTGYIQQEPLWYRAVLEHPPLPLPPRSPPIRLPSVAGAKPYDLPSTASTSTATADLRKPPKVKTQPIVYIEDEVRQQFFRDHPFEAFRERSLVEADVIEGEHPIRGAKWTRLSQRGRNPKPEDVVRFTVNLYEHTPGLSLSDAYVSACMQYAALRSEQEIASKIALAEAEFYGITFKPTEIERAFQREAEHMKSWEVKKYTEAESMEARKRWRMHVDRPTNALGGEPMWTRGETYTRLWKEGVRPDYSPAVSAPLEGEEVRVTEHVR